MPGDEDYSANLPALSRFKTGKVPWATDDDEFNVTLTTNLPGEPIRFTLQEALDNPVSTASITMLNASIDDSGHQVGGLISMYSLEEDQAAYQWTHSHVNVKLNSFVFVTESAGGLGTCTTTWRVVSVTSYVDNNDIPYYDVQLESLGAAALNVTFSPSRVVEDTETALFVERKYYEALLKAHQKTIEVDGYVPKIDVTPSNPVISQAADSARYVADAQSWLSPFVNAISALGTISMTLPSISICPLMATYNKGDNCWQIICDIAAQGGLFPRFNRENRVEYYNIYAPFEGKTGSVMGFSDSGKPIYAKDGGSTRQHLGNLDRGLQLSYTKEGIASVANVTGYIGVKNSNGDWIPDQKSPEKITVKSGICSKLLQGESVEININVDERYLLSSKGELVEHGQRELLKTALSARGASYSGENIPLNVEVGRMVSASSRYSGFAGIFITTFNRTTDAQKNSVSTSLSGIQMAESGGSVTAAGWL